MTTLPIQFLFQELANNEQDREPFNSVSPSVRVFQAKYLNFEIYFSENYQRAKTQLAFRGENLHKQTDIVQEKIIRTCLSRIDGEAVLGVLHKIYDEHYSPYAYNCLCEELYESFDRPLWNGHPLSEAIEALHEKMLELVPEYVTFCEEQAKKN